MKNILVTGAGCGIGFAIAKSIEGLADELILITKSKSFETLKQSFPNARNFKTDLTSESDLESLIDKVTSELNRLDVLVNNAGFYVGEKFENTNVLQLDELYKLHLRVPFLLIQKFLPLMKKSNRPQIINISSAANFARLPGESAYTAVKSGLSAMGDTLRSELQSQKIQVTTIHPWAVNTHDSKNPENFLRPEDIGELVTYILRTHPNCQIMNVELSAVSDWRGGWPPWIPE